MQNQIRVGIIGTSWWTDLMFLPSLKSHPLAGVRSICGRNIERANEMAAKYNVPNVFNDYHELIRKGDLDAIVIATPDDLHHEMTMEALGANLHVLCEKPMALNTLQAQEMVEEAEARGVKHMEVHHNGTPLEPNFYDGLQVQKIIDAGLASQRSGCWVEVR